jgi:hypothetical protein
MKVLSFLFGGFAVFNLLTALPAMFSGAPAGWIFERIICGIIFGAVSYFLARKAKNNQAKKTNTNNSDSQKSVANNSEDRNTNNSQQQLFTSQKTEDIAKKIFLVASNSISEVIEESGALTKKGICEAILFNTTIILNDKLFNLKTDCQSIKDDYLILLLLLIRKERPDLDTKGLSEFLDGRLNFYAKEYNKLLGENQYSPMWVYSTFYLAPLEDEPKLSLDPLELIIFHTGLIKMANKVHELLDIELQKI